MQRQLIRDGHCDGIEGRIVDNANYLRDAVWGALDGALGSAMRIMAWLRYAAEEASEAGVALQWVTPTGFLVIQEYLQQRETKLYTALQRITMRQPCSEAGIDRARQVRGIPPNLVHSFDAAHMMLTALECEEAGIVDFAAVHDSFGTHPNDVDKMDKLLRETFIEMYSKDILAGLHKQWSLWIGKQLDPPPAIGSLDLACVAESKYFFA
jgi:DNA-directed RNA polymerase